jgi:uncharacterized membrane protein YeaQ/YmgE (transglycosylase-associated protein family)
MAIGRAERERSRHALDPGPMGVVAWIALGAAAGCIAGRLRPMRLPGGTWAATAAGMAGGFVGGGIAALAGGGNSTAVALPSVFAAIVGAALLIVMIGRAARTQPRAEPPARARPTDPAAPGSNGHRTAANRRAAIAMDATLERSSDASQDRR